MWQDAVRWIARSWLTTKFQTHILIRTLLHWLLPVFLFLYDGPHCGALPVKRAPSRLIPFYRFPRRLLIARPTRPIRRFSHRPRRFQANQTEHVACLRSSRTLVRCHEISCSFHVARSPSGFLYLIGVSLVNILVDLESSAKTSVLSVLGFRCILA